MKHIKILILLTVFCTLGIYSGQANEIKGLKAVRFKIAYTGSKLVALDSIGFDLYITKYPIAFPLIVETQALHISKKVGYNEMISLDLKSPANDFYIFITYSRMPWNNLNTMYMLSAGDDLVCNLTEKGITFSGKGSEKLQCQADLNQLTGDLRFIADDSLLPARKEDEYYDQMRILRDSMLRLQLKVVEGYKDRLSSETYKIMLANCYGLRSYDELVGIRGTLRFSRTSNYYEVYGPLERMYRKRNYNDGQIGILGDKIMVKSPYYVQALYHKIYAEEMFNRGEGYTLYSSNEFIKSIFDQIIKNPSVVIRSKLLTIFLLQLQSIDSKEFYSFCEQSMKYIIDESDKELILGLIDLKKPGTMFADFTLQGVDGKVVNQSIFKDKIVYLDFWYTGCTACALLNKAMKPIIEKYGNNQKIMFVSVSIDENREKWLNSVKIGKYTDPKSLNLYTEGLGDQHPLIKKYNIMGYPAVFLLKNGKIYVNPVPRPVEIADKKDGPHSESTLQLMKIFDQALKDF